MPSPAVTLVDSSGFPISTSATAVVAAGAGTTVIKNGPGRLGRITVTGAAPTGVLTFYDNTSGSGKVLAVIPASGVSSGQSFDVQMPAGVGITAVGSTGSAAVTVSYS